MARLGRLTRHRVLAMARCAAPLIFLELVIGSTAPADGGNRCHESLKAKARDDRRCSILLKACENATKAGGLDGPQRQLVLELIGPEFDDVLPAAGTTTVDWCRVWAKVKMQPAGPGSGTGRGKPVSRDLNQVVAFSESWTRKNASQILQQNYGPAMLAARIIRFEPAARAGSETCCAIVVPAWISLTRVDAAAGKPRTERAYVLFHHALGRIEGQWMRLNLRALGYPHADFLRMEQDRSIPLVELKQYAKTLLDTACSEGNRVLGLRDYALTDWAPLGRELPRE